MSRKDPGGVSTDKSAGTEPPAHTVARASGRVGGQAGALCAWSHRGGLTGIWAERWFHVLTRKRKTQLVEPIKATNPPPALYQDKYLY